MVPNPKREETGLLMSEKYIIHTLPRINSRGVTGYPNVLYFLSIKGFLNRRTTIPSTVNIANIDNVNPMYESSLSKEAVITITIAIPAWKNMEYAGVLFIQCTVSAMYAFW